MLHFLHLTCPGSILSICCPHQQLKHIPPNNSVDWTQTTLRWVCALCRFYTVHNTHTYGTFFTQSCGAWFISCSKWLWGKWASSVCRILLTAKWVLPLSLVKAIMPLQKPAIKFLFKRGLDFTTSYMNDRVSQSVIHQMRGCTTEATWIPLEGQQAIQTHRAPIKGARWRVDKGNIYHLG